MMRFLLDSEEKMECITFKSCSHSSWMFTVYLLQGSSLFSCHSINHYELTLLLMHFVLPAMSVKHKKYLHNFLILCQINLSLSKRKVVSYNKIIASHSSFSSSIWAIMLVGKWPFYVFCQLSSNSHNLPKAICSRANRFYCFETTVWCIWPHKNLLCQWSVSTKLVTETRFHKEK